MKNLDFNNNMSENIISHPYMANERLQEEEKPHSKNYFWKDWFSGQNHFKKWITKTECYSKNYIKRF